MRRHLREDFDYDSLLRHIKHVIEYQDDPRCSKEANNLIKEINKFSIKYNQIADSLAASPAGRTDSNDLIIGYIQKDGRIAKYNRSTGDFVVYQPKNNRNVTKTLHKKTYNEFLNTMKNYYKDELIENQDN